MSNFEIKFQLTNEYLRNGGTEKIKSQKLLQELLDVKYNQKGKPIESSFGSLLKAFMNSIFISHNYDLTVSEEYIFEYKSILQKSYSFDQIQIDTEVEFDKFYKEYCNTVNILFRGQREASWRLINSLQRNWINSSLKEKMEYEVLVKKLVFEGNKKYKKEIEKILTSFNIDSINEIAVLGYLQHHSCPTPLLDWTYSFDNALYFGLDGIQANHKILEINNYFSVYFLEEEHFQTGGYKELIQETLNTLSEEFKNNIISKIAKNKKQEKEMKKRFKNRSFFDKKRFDGSGLIKKMTKIEHLLNFPITFFSDKDVSSGLIFSLNNSPNILNQRGVFTWNNHPYKPLEVISKEQYFEDKSDKSSIIYRFCKCFNINKKLATYISNKLAAKGINEDFIYPSGNVNAWEIFENSIE